MPRDSSELKSVYDSSDAITREVLQRFALTPDPRLREIVVNLIFHLHQWAEDTNLSWQEWQRAMQYLAKAGEWCKGPRNEFIALSDSIGLTMKVVDVSQPKPEGATLPTLVGPFHTPNAPDYQNGADLANGAKGTPLYVSGRVLDTRGRPIANATVETWHSDEEGLYDVQVDPSKPWARGRVRSDAEGRYSFWTVMPTPYPAPTDGALGDLFMNTTKRYYRPAHLHYMVNAESFDPLITHIFVRGSQYIDEDVAFGVRPKLIYDFPRHEPGKAPDGRVMKQAFHTLNCDIVMTAKGR